MVVFPAASKPIMHIFKDVQKLMLEFALGVWSADIIERRRLRYLL